MTTLQLTDPGVACVYFYNHRPYLQQQIPSLALHRSTFLSRSRPVNFAPVNPDLELQTQFRSGHSKNSQKRNIKIAYNNKQRDEAYMQGKGQRTIRNNLLCYNLVTITNDLKSKWVAGSLDSNGHLMSQREFHFVLFPLTQPWIREEIYYRIPFCWI